MNKEITLLEKEAQSLTIITDKEMTSATELLSRINHYKDNLTEEKEKLTKPLNEALKEIRGRYKPQEEILDSAIVKIRSAMSSYQKAVIEKQKADEQKVLDRVEKGTLKIETASKKLSEMKQPEKKIESASGSIRFREDKVLKIISEELIPREYLVINEKSILADLKLGKQVPGAQIEIVQTPINSR